MLKGGVKVVSGFVPIPDNPRSPEEYFELGSRLFDPLRASGQLKYNPACFMMEHISQCWLFKWLHWKGQNFDVTHSVADNPKKNTPSYHIVQHQKFEWLLDAATLDPRPDVFVWIDFGILHVQGVTVAVILEFLRRVEREQAVAIPGCWDKRVLPIDDQNPCWRFCGGLMVVPRQHIFELDMAVKINAMKHIHETRNLSWEVNTLARVEQAGTVPLWWYKADHNETMFTAYPETAHA